MEDIYVRPKASE